MSTQPSEPDPGTTGSDRFHLAVRVVAGGLPPTKDLPFGHPDTLVPDRIDKRVILNIRIWIDRNAQQHRLEDMSRDYRANVLCFLQHEAPGWVADAQIAELVTAMLGVVAPRVVSNRLEVLELLTPGWTDHTPLGLRLHELNHTQPPPLAAPRPRLTAERSDSPEILRDHDRGLWQVTTFSTTTYLIDLDRRRIQRRPPEMRANGNGHRPAALASQLPFDGAWVDLECLIQCRTGAALIAFDHRPSSYGRGGYRVSTDVLRIQRATGGRPPSDGAPGSDPV